MIHCRVPSTRNTSGHRATHRHGRPPRNAAISGYLWGLCVSEASFTLNMQTFVTLLGAESMLPTALGGQFVEKEMATHSSTLAWKIPWMEEHGGPQSMGSRRVGHD